MKNSKTITVMRRASILLIAVSALCAQTQKPLAEGANASAVVQTEILDPFIHETHILAGSDLKSIRFEGVKRVNVTTHVEVILDPDLCQNETRERGGSLFCPMVEAVSYEPAYQITYSYLGPPLASHEYAGQRFTFSFFFRPEELDGSEPGSFASDNGAAAESLRVAISRESRQGFVIDEKSSTLCPGYYADGEWVYEDSACREKLVLNTVTVPSDYVTIGIESLQGRVSIRSQRFL